VNLAFPLTADEDGWPPFGSESLYVTKSEVGWRVEVAPLFVKGISVYDEGVVELNSEGYVKSWNCIIRSRRSVVWVLMKFDFPIDDILLQLGELGCGHSLSKEAGMLSIDLPESVKISELDQILFEVIDKTHGVAYPSFRHV
jgi:hypothetical protein